jgi:NADH-quinone oxidoreductase subunit C
MTSQELAKNLRAKWPAELSDPVEFRGESTLSLSQPGLIAEVCRFAKQDLGFDYLVDITSLDNYGEDPRFEVVYHLYSYRERAYLRLRVRLGEDNPEIPSVIGVWRSADWHEREAYDMMGIRFSGHPDLRRILMWEGYPYFPLRKDFPVGGKPTLIPEVAFTEAAPLVGGPFITVAGATDATSREPRARIPETESPAANARGGKA